MENINHISKNCKFFIDQYISCKYKEINIAKKNNIDLSLKSCLVFYDLTKICVNSYIDYEHE